MKKWIVCMVAMLLLAACTDSWKPTLDKLDEIEELHRTDMDEARIEMELLKMQLRGDSLPLRMKARILMLECRLRGNGNFASLDPQMADAVSYYDSHGTPQERQTVHYYAGCARRDLDDMPLAVEHYQQSVCEAEAANPCDSTLLRAALRNLFRIFISVEHYPLALDIAKSECAVFSGGDTESLARLGQAYLAIDSCAQAKECFERSLGMIGRMKQLGPDSFMTSECTDALTTLLGGFATLGDTARARECHKRLKQTRIVYSSVAHFYMINGDYHRMANHPDSAIAAYQHAVGSSALETQERYDALRRLYSMALQQGDKARSAVYADSIIALGNRMAIGKKRELLSFTLSQQQLGWQRRVAAAFMAESASLRTWLMAVTALSLLAAIAFVTTLLCIRTRQLRQTAAQLAELRQLHEEKHELESAFATMLHHTDLTDNAHDIYQLVQKSVNGQHNMSDADWRQLYKAVDEAFPAFSAKMQEFLPTLDKLQTQILYLIRIGLNSNQIKNVTNLPRTTAWRWVHKFQDLIPEETCSINA